MAKTKINNDKKNEAKDTRTAKDKAKDMLVLFLTFFKIGLFSFGGGYAMLTMFETEFVERKKWLTHAELADIFAIAESTPGAIAINIATFIGTKRCGILGGLVATLGVIVPSFAIIVAISYIIDLVKDNRWVEYLFKGIRIGVLVLILRSVVTFYKDMKKNVGSFALLVAAFLIAFLTDVSVIYIILGAIVLTAAYVGVRNIVYEKKYHLKGTAAYVYPPDCHPENATLENTEEDKQNGENGANENENGSGENTDNGEIELNADGNGADDKCSDDRGADTDEKEGRDEK